MAKLASGTLGHWHPMHPYYQIGLVSGIRCQLQNLIVLVYQLKKQLILPRILLNLSAQKHWAIPGTTASIFLDLQRGMLLCFQK